MRNVIVVGAGPAGLAAAVAAADGGARVTLLDAEARPGGQYWRQGPGGPDRHHDRAGWGDLAARLAGHESAGRVDRRQGVRVWRIEPVAASNAPAVVVHAVTAAPSEAGGESPWTVTARAVVVATGAHDRVLPFPGWDLPGVLTPGAVQALLTEHGVPAGRRVVLGGSGPFLLPVAVALLRAGAAVPALVEAGDGGGWAGAWRQPGVTAERAAEALGYARVLARHRVRPRLRHAVVAAHGTDRVEAVTIARVDRRGAVVTGTERQVGCDAVAVGWGFTARCDLALSAGAVAVTGPDGGVAVAADACGRTAVHGLLVAGELTGVGGATLALVTGRLAGAAAAALAVRGTLAAPDLALLARRRRLTAFARTLHAAHPVPPDWTGWLRPDTLVCRCEEVPVARVVEAVDDLGAGDARTVKLLTRCGMGWCQGRICGEAVTAIVAARTGTAPAPSLAAAAAARPVAVPLTLAALIRNHEPAPGGDS